ncbi:MAG: tetratricopeptide repeat protein [Gemmatimonadetes bacterium]|nr:tetratricopeptide repeat protein [Gemmatimonadota bacterium]
MRNFLRLSLPAFTVLLIGLSCAGNPNFIGGKNYVKQGVWDKAANEFELAIEADPSNAEAYYYLGWARTETGEFQKAAEAFSQCRAMSDEFDEQCDQKAKSHFDNLAAQGQQAKEAGNFKLAAEKFDLALLLLDSNVDAFLYAADIDAQMGNIDEAVAMYERALELEPENPGGLANYALLLDDNGRYLDAIPVYQRYIEVADESHKEAVRGTICILYGKAGDEQRELECYQELGNVIPLLNKAHEAYQAENYDEAVNLYSTVRRVSEPGSEEYFEASYNTMVTYYRMEDFGNAIEIGETLVEEKANDPQVWRLLGNSYSKAKRPQDSLRALKKAEDLSR